MNGPANAALRRALAGCENKQAAGDLGLSPGTLCDVKSGRRAFSAGIAARMIVAGWPRAEVEQIYFADCTARLDRAVAERQAGQ